MQNLISNPKLYGYVDPFPFVPRNPATRDARCREIANIMKHGLSKRLRYVARVTGQSEVTVAAGISGGLDSTSMLCGIIDVFDMHGWPRKKIITPTMPGYGTTPKTRRIAERLCEYYRTDFRVIPISEQVTAHLKAIGAGCVQKSATGEPCQNCLQCQNAQAREREKILMDLAFTVNSSDMSEIFLGFSTKGADQTGMYAIQPGMPKTLVKHFVLWRSRQAEISREPVLAEILYDAAMIDYSPELTKDVQITEQLIGPYELNDFTMFYVVRNGFAPRKILFLQEQAAKIPTEQGGYSKMYTLQELAKWMCMVYERFPLAQYKRDDAPDGPQFGSVALSKTGAFRWPPEMDLRTWIGDIKEISQLAA